MDAEPSGVGSILENTVSHGWPYSFERMSYTVSIGMGVTSVRSSSSALQYSRGKMSERMDRICPNVGPRSSKIASAFSGVSPCVS